ncbi:hypothetical protein V6Z12_D08G174300 [Gossypium hirsutum]
MTQALAMRGIKIPNFTYDFPILEEPHRLSDISDGSLLVSFLGFLGGLQWLTSSIATDVMKCHSLRFFNVYVC